MKSKRSIKRPHGADSGAHWISYSDMMAALLMVFVLAVLYSIYQYYSMLEIKTKQLNEQQAVLDQAQITLVERETELEKANVTLMGKQEELTAIQIQLDAKEQDLNAAQLSLTEAQEGLAEKEQTLIILQGALDAQAAELDSLRQTLSAQKGELLAQQKKIDALVGVRSEIISDLSSAFARNNIRATVDKTTGDIRLESQVFFETNSSEIKESGKEYLQRFLPVYLSVLMRDEYKDFVGEIIIEGHTDTAGSYITNLKLSQNRALTVATYCLEMDTLSPDMKKELQNIMTATGRSYSDPVYNADGSVNMEASRRVEFKFRLKDAEMINEMNRLLSEME